MMRMTSSGTEAAMTAIRLARARTGREIVIKFAGAYHGHSDGLLAQAGSGLATQGIPASPGVPAATAAGTVVVPWNDRDALESATERHSVAAIIAVPRQHGADPSVRRVHAVSARARRRVRRAADPR
jgi:glutamate-1-semialdehyde 2,1-aminomutase